MIKRQHDVAVHIVLEVGRATLETRQPRQRPSWPT